MRRVREALVVATIGLSACGGGTEPVGGGPSGPSGPSGPTDQCPSTTSVTVQNNFFSPSCARVALGGTVTWTWGNNASNGHNVTFATGQNSETVTSGTFQRSFPTAGTFAYECTIHPGMDGEIRVQ